MSPAGIPVGGGHALGPESGWLPDAVNLCPVRGCRPGGRRRAASLLTGFAAGTPSSRSSFPPGASPAAVGLGSGSDLSRLCLCVTVTQRSGEGPAILGCVAPRDHGGLHGVTGWQARSRCVTERWEVPSSLGNAGLQGGQWPEGGRAERLPSLGPRSLGSPELRPPPGFLVSNTPLLPASPPH